MSKSPNSDTPRDIDFVSCSEHDIKFWCVEDTSRCVNVINEKGRITTGISVGPFHLAVGIDNGRIKVYDANSCECLHIYPGFSSPVVCLCLVGRNKLVAGYCDRSIKLFTLKNEKPSKISPENFKVFEGHKSSVRSLACINRNAFASGSDGGNIKIWNVEKVLCVKTILAFKKSPVLSLLMLNKKILISSSFNEIKFWNFLSKGVCTRVLSSQSGRIYQVCKITEDKIVSVSSNQSIYVWDVERGKAVDSYNEHTKDVKSISNLQAFGVFVTGSADKTLKIWEVVSGRCMSTINHDSAVVAVFQFINVFDVAKFSRRTMGILSEKCAEEKLITVSNELEACKKTKELLKKEVEFLKSENEKLKEKDLAQQFETIEKLINEFEVAKFEREYKNIHLESLRLFRKKALDDEIGYVDQVLQQYLKKINKFEKNIFILEEDKIFKVVNKLKDLQKNRDGNLNVLREKKKAMQTEAEKIQLVKMCCERQIKLKNSIKSLENFMITTKNIRSSINDKFDEKFIEYKRSIDIHIDDFNKTLYNIDKEKNECDQLLNDQTLFIKKNADLGKYFVNLQSKVKDIEAKIKDYRQFYYITFELYDVLKNLIAGMNFKYILKKHHIYLERQKVREDKNNTLEKNFKAIFLKNNRLIDKVEKIDKEINEGCTSLIEKITKELKNFNEAFNLVNSMKDYPAFRDCKLMKESVISEIKQMMKKLNDVHSDLKDILKNNEVHYGKIYEYEKKGVLGGYIKVKKKRMIYFGQMKDGIRNGIGKEFYEDGKTIKFYGRFKDGERFGRGEEYDREGKLINRGEYSTNGVQLRIYKLSELMGKVDTVKDLLGKGSFGEVYKIRMDGTTYAMKRLFLKKENVKEISRFKNEVKILSRLRHPNIITIYGWGEYEDSTTLQFGIIVEYCPNKVKYNVSFGSKIKLLLQISQGMDFLHSKDIIHRDLKFENVLIDKFGQAKLIAMGTPGYIAPEVIEDKEYTEKCDIFSFGIMMFNLLIQTDDPFDTQNNPDPFFAFRLSSLVVQGLRPKIKDSFVIDKKNKWYVDLMTCCWKQAPEARPSFKEIIEIINKNFNP